MNHKNPFFLFISACIPGCGQMYQGYMKRGVSLLAAFCAVIAVSVWLYMGQLALFLPVLWLYAFFDTYNLRRAQGAGLEEPDAYLFGLSSIDREQLERLFSKRHSLIGWCLVAVGVYGLWGTVSRYLADFLAQFFPHIDIYWFVSYQLPRMFALLLVVGLGAWFIRGPKQPPEDGGDFPGYAPPSPGKTSAPEPDGAAGAQSAPFQPNPDFYPPAPDAAAEAEREPEETPRDAADESAVPEEGEDRHGEQ